MIQPRVAISHNGETIESNDTTTTRTDIEGKLFTWQLNNHLNTSLKYNLMANDNSRIDLDEFWQKKRAVTYPVVRWSAGDRQRSGAKDYDGKSRVQRTTFASRGEVDVELKYHIYINKS